MVEKYDREKHCGFGEPIWDLNKKPNEEKKEQQRNIANESK